jgi:hypothetical protein
LSTAHSNALWLRPYGEIDTSVPDCGVTVLPGRLAALTHPLNRGRTIQLPDREIYDPDLATVVSSGIAGFDKGDVVILAPDHGAYYPNVSPDGRELRIVGVACPWWESVLAKYDHEGIHPAPGWMLVEIVVQDSSPVWVQLGRAAPQPTATVLASHGDHHTEPYKGERVVIDGLRTYTIPEQQLALVRAPIASKQWLQSLRTN